MTLEELSDNYSIELEKLRYFADSGLIETKADYSGSDLRRIGTMCRLYDMGFFADDIKVLLHSGQKECADVLKRRRRNILESIHREQKMLDDIDYMIHAGCRGEK